MFRFTLVENNIILFLVQGATIFIRPSVQETLNFGYILIDFRRFVPCSELGYSVILIIPVQGRVQ